MNMWPLGPTAEYRHAYWDLPFSVLDLLIIFPVALHILYNRFNGQPKSNITNAAMKGAPRKEIHTG